jgi:hypothetical protein
LHARTKKPGYWPGFLQSRRWTASLCIHALEEFRIALGVAELVEQEVDRIHRTHRFRIRRSTYISLSCCGSVSSSSLRVPERVMSIAGKVNRLPVIID